MAVSTTTANGPQTGGGGGTWGSITGTLADQTDLQSAIDAKAAASGYTASRVLTTSAGGAIAVSSITTTTLAYLDATSSIQTQLDAKAADSAVVKLTGTQTVAGAKTFSSDMALTSGTASTTTGTGALVVTGGIGASGAINHAGTFRCTNTTDSTSISSGSAVFSGGVGVTKMLYAGTGFTLTAGNILVTSGNIGVDSGVSGNITNCPTNVFCNYVYSKTGYAFAANSATTGLQIVPDSSTSVSLKNGSTALFSCTTTQNYFLNRIHLGNGENTILNFGANTGFDSNNAAAVVVYQFDTTGRDNWVFCARVYGVMRRTDSGTEYGQIAKSMMWSRESGTVTVRGAIQDIHPDNYVTMAPTGISQDASGNNLRIIFTGETSKRIEGNFYVFLTMHST